MSILPLIYVLLKCRGHPNMNRWYACVTNTQLTCTVLYTCTTVNNNMCIDPYLISVLNRAINNNMCIDPC